MSDHTRSEHILEGLRWNTIWPEQPSPGEPHMSARDYALRTFFDYLAEVTWRHTGTSLNAPPVDFRIRRCNMYVEQPEAGVKLAFPSIAVMPNAFAPASPWLGGPCILEDTWDKYGDHSVLVKRGEFEEEIMLDMWFATRAQRRAVLAGMEGSVLTTEQGPLYLKLPDYYDRIAVFDFIDDRRFDGDHAVKNRREAQVRMNMRVEVVFKALFPEHKPQAFIEIE